jgi:hypothetical protein
MPDSLELLCNTTSPLALAALALLLIFGIARAAFSSKAKQQRAKNADLTETHRTQRAVINWGFATAILLGVLANVSALATPIFAGEIRVSGTVLDSSGRPLPNATVDFLGIRRVLSQDTGEFEFSIPRSRARPTYEVNASCPGFSPFKADVAGPSPNPLAIRLLPVEVTYDRVISGVQHATVGHWLGVPFLIVELAVRNPLSVRTQLSGLSFLVTDGADARSLQPVALQMAANMPFSPFVQPWPLDAGAEWRGLWFFSLNDPAIEMRGRRAREHAAAHGSLADLDLGDLEAQFERVFIWRPGTWTATLAFTVGAASARKSFTFKLTAEDVQRFRDSKKRFKEPEVMFIESALAARPPVCFCEVSLLTKE